MSTTFDIQKLIQKAHFGDAVTLFKRFQKIKKDNSKMVDAMAVGKHASGVDVLGRPYFMDFFITLASESGESSGEKYRLPNEPLVAISQKNNIKKTEVIGRERFGTVKEFIANDDYIINIYGVCVDTKNPDSYPTEQVRKLNEVAKLRGSMEVENDLLRLLGIYKICVESLDIDEMIGEPYAQKYRMQLVSDVDFLAELSEKKDMKILTQ